MRDADDEGAICRDAPSRRSDPLGADRRADGTLRALRLTAEDAPRRYG